MPSMFGDNIVAPGAAPLPDPVLEANHRIANNLAIIAALIRSELLTLTKYASDPSYTRRLLQQMSLRIDAVARLHRLRAGARLMSGIAHDLGAYLTFEKSNPGQIVRLEIPAPTERDATIEGQEGRSRTGRAQ